MKKYTSKFSPAEKKALELAARYHHGQKRIGGEDYITHPMEVADLLFHYQYRGKYVFTALCHDLLEDTEVSEQEIVDTCGRFTLEAVKLLTKPWKIDPSVEVDMETYLAGIRKNEVAYPVKVADRTMNLWNAKVAGIAFQERYLKETEQYYLEFAKDSPLFGELVDAYETLKLDHDLKKRSLIAVEIEEIQENQGEEAGPYVVMECFSHNGLELLPLCCMIQREELVGIIGTGDGGMRKYSLPITITITVTGFPVADLRRYASVEAYEDATRTEGKFSVASQSILYMPSETLDPHALVTGVIRGIQGTVGLDPKEEGEELTQANVVCLEVLGSILTMIIKEEACPDPKPGEVISGIFRLFADVSAISADL